MESYLHAFMKCNLDLDNFNFHLSLIHFYFETNLLFSILTTAIHHVCQTFKLLLQSHNNIAISQSVWRGGGTGWTGMKIDGAMPLWNLEFWEQINPSYKKTIAAFQKSDSITDSDNSLTSGYFYGDLSSPYTEHSPFLAPCTWLFHT